MRFSDLAFLSSVTYLCFKDPLYFMPNFNVFIPDDLADKIDEAIEKTPPYENRSQYVRAAIREKLTRDNGGE